MFEDKVGVSRRHFLGLSAAAVAMMGTPAMATRKIDDEWWYPAWVEELTSKQGAEYGPITVRDTDSALGRYNVPGRAKTVGLKDLTRIHGHMCDGLVYSFILLKAALTELYGVNGIVDRTDLRVVSPNSPCMHDAASFMTGARVNFKTLRIMDNDFAGIGFVVQRISDGRAILSKLKDGVFPSDLEEAEKAIRSKQAAGKSAEITGKEIDAAEKEALKFIKTLLTAPSANRVALRDLPVFEFKINVVQVDDTKHHYVKVHDPSNAGALDLADYGACHLIRLGDRGDVKNKNVSRT